MLPTAGLVVLIRCEERELLAGVGREPHRRVPPCFVNEQRAEKAAEALHDQIRHETTVIRHGRASSLDVTSLVPGDIVELHLGDIVPPMSGWRSRRSPVTSQVLTGE